MKKLLSLVLILVVCFTFAACGNGDNTVTDPENIVNPITVYMTIETDDSVDADDFEGFDEAKFIVEEGSNVLDATQVFCVGNGLKYELSKDGTYFTTLAGVSEGDYAATTGWVYELNDESLMVPSGECEIKDGDEITWKFVDYSSYEW